MIVTFAGHHDTPPHIYSLLYKTLQHLIEGEGAKSFYVGDRGDFDKMAIYALKELKKIYPSIEYRVILAYMPREKGDDREAENTLLPAEVAVAPARYAIDRRNRWMIANSDTVIVYVKRSYGGAAAFRKRALSKGKRIIDL